MYDVKIAADISDRLVSWRMLDDAATVLQNCLKRYPGQPELTRRLGRIRLQQGDVDAAVPFLESAVAHDRLMNRTRQTS